MQNKKKFSLTFSSIRSLITLFSQAITLPKLFYSRIKLLARSACPKFPMKFPIVFMGIKFLRESLTKSFLRN